MPLDKNLKDADLAAPPITLCASQADELESLASGAMRRAPDVAERLLREIERATIIPDDELPADVVALGREVTYRDETTGHEQTIVLVPPRDADIAQKRASVLTPIGVTLIGLRQGASFSWETRDGKPRRLTVTRVASLSVGAA